MDASATVPEDDPSMRMLSDVVEACAAARLDKFCYEALPPLRALTAASTAILLDLRHGPGGTKVDGERLDPEDLPDPTEATATEERPDDGALGWALDVPASWAERGIRQVRARRLGDGTALLVLAYASTPRAPGEAVLAALALIDTKVGALDAASQLRDLAARVDNAQQLARMGDYDWHIASDTNRWSDQLYRIYGHEPQSFSPSYERFLSHVHPEDRERIREIHQTAYATGEPYAMIERIVRPDGELRYLSSNGQVVHNAAGTPIRMRGTCIDVTDRVIADQESELAAGRFRSLVESSPDAIVVFDREGVALQSNDRAREVLAGDPTGQRIGRLLPPLETGSSLGVTAHGLDGRDVLIDVTIRRLVVPDDTGLVAAYLHDAHDRLDREGMAAQLRESEVRRRQALEINDSVVQGLTAALYADESGDRTLSHRYVERTLVAARRIIDELLQPSPGGELSPGDLIRSMPASLDVLSTSEVSTEVDDSTDVSEGTTGSGAAAEEYRGAEPESPQPETPDADTPATTDRRVLVVDDCEDLRALLVFKVDRIPGFTVVGEACDGAEAVAMAAKTRPDLVLLDLAMPLMDGLQALPLILTEVPEARVIVLSGFDGSTMADKALAAGAHRYVEKGRAMTQLAAVITELVPA